MDDPDHRTWLCFRFSPRGIHTVTMESQGGNNCVLFGLKEPKKFVEVVMAMKHKRDEHKRRMIIAGAEGAGLESQNALLASLKEIASTNRRMVHALSMNSSINKSDGTCPTANITIPSSMDDDSTARSSSMDDSAVWSLDDSKRAMDDSHLSLSPRDIKEVIPKDMYQVDDAAKDQDKGKDLPDDSSEPEEVKETRVLPDGTKVESKLTAWSDGHSKQVIKTTRKNDDGSKSVKREIKKVSAEGKLRVSITEDITYPDGRKERIETTKGSRGSKKTKL